MASADLVPLLIGLAFIQATIGTSFTPARGALMPRLVPASGLLAANAITQATRVIAGVIGAGLAGLIVGVAGVTWPAFVLDAVTFLASALIVMGIPAALGAPGSDAARIAGGMRSAVVEGLRVVAGSRLLWTTLLALAVSMFGLGAVNVLFLPLIVDVLQVSPVWLGGVDAAQSASMILSAGIVAVLASRLRPTTIITVAILATGILVALTGAATEIWQVLLLLFAIGWFLTPLQASVVTVMQTGVPDAARGRVMATLQASMSGASIGSMALAGVFGDLIGIREVFIAAGTIVVVGGLVAAALYRGTTNVRATATDATRPDTVSGLEEGVA